MFLEDVDGGRFVDVAFRVEDGRSDCKTSAKNANQQMQIRVVGLPESLPDSDICECVVAATNTSNQAVNL